jgi:hypothetical protein
MPMTPGLMELIARDHAARTVDPLTLTDAEKNAKILALQARNTEMEEVATFLASLLLGIERETKGAGANDRAYRRRILALCAETRRCVIPVTLVEPVTGQDVFARRAL